MSALINTKKMPGRHTRKMPGKNKSAEKPPQDNIHTGVVVIALAAAVVVAVVAIVVNRFARDTDTSSSPGPVSSAEQPSGNPPDAVETPQPAESPAETTVANSEQPIEVDQEKIAAQQADIFSERLEKDMEKPPEERSRNLPSKETIQLLRAGKIVIE